MADLSSFFFDVEKWRGSKAVQRMSYAERGVYLDMLIEQWLKRSLPDDPEAVVLALAVTPIQEAEIRAAWPMVRRSFVNAPDQKRIYNPPLERVRRQQVAFRRTKQLAGSHGGKTTAKRRAAKVLTERMMEASSAVAVLEPAVADSSVERGREGKRGDETRREERGGGAAHGTKQPPLNLGLRRLKVWRWMLEEWIVLLGPNADAFDLEAWLKQLDRRDDGIVLNHWEFLRAEFFEEVRRRGLAADTVAGSEESRFAALTAKGPSVRP